MADNKINVGGRLHSIATGNILAGADEILDDSKGKKQSEVNIDVDNALADRYTKDETYDKNQLNSLITTPNVQYVTVIATAQTTVATDILPSIGAANTVYRVGKWDGTQYNTAVYSEYAWDGSVYVLLSIKEYGIDDEPTVESDNLVKSGGVYKKMVDVEQTFSEEVVFENFGFIQLYDINVGSTISLDSSLFSRDSNYRCAKIPVEFGDIMFISTKNNTPSAKAYAITDADGTVIDIERYANDKILYAPLNSSWIVINTGVGGYAKVIRKKDINRLGVIVRDTETLFEEKDIRNGNFLTINQSGIATKMIATHGATMAYIVTNRPNRTGCSYRYGYCVSDSINDIGKKVIQTNLSGNTSRLDATIDKTSALQEFGNSQKCIGFNIREYDYSNSTFKTLNIYDFNGYYIKVVMSNGLENIIKSYFKSSITSVDDIPTAGAIMKALNTNRIFNNGLNRQYYNLSSASVGNVLVISIASGPDYTGIMLDVNPGETYILNTKDNTASCKAYAILDSNNTVLSLSQTASNLWLTMPQNAAHLIVNTKVTEGNDFLIAVNQKVRDITPSNNYNDKSKSIILDTNINLLETGDKYYFTTTKEQFVASLSAVVGQPFTVSTSRNSSYTYEDIQVQENDVFIGRCEGNTPNAKAYIILDNNSIVLKIADSWNEEIVSMPAGAARFIVNTINTGSGQYLKKILGKFDDCVKIDDFKDFVSTSLKVSLEINATGRYIYCGEVAVGDSFLIIRKIAASGYGYYIGKTVKGEKYHIKTTGNTKGAKSYVVLDNDFKVLELQQSSGTYDITIEQNGWIIINTTTTGNYEITLSNWYDRVVKGIYDNIKASIYDIARYNNKFQFDLANIAELHTNGIKLGFYKNVPTSGQFINTDIFENEELTDSKSIDYVQKRIVPYLYWKQQKVGTWILYDDTTGKPYYYDKNGNKVILATE